LGTADCIYCVILILFPLAVLWGAVLHVYGGLEREIFKKASSLRHARLAFCGVMVIIWLLLVELFLMLPKMQWFNMVFCPPSLLVSLLALSQFYAKLKKRALRAKEDTLFITMSIAFVLLILLQFLSRYSS